MDTPFYSDGGGTASSGFHPYGLVLDLSTEESVDGEAASPDEYITPSQGVSSVKRPYR